MAYRLGIDTGGTYTDAVLVDEQQQVVASFKSLTTREDLSVGIGRAIAGLDSNMLLDIELCSLSTTLTTNSVVEGHGANVAVLLAGYNSHQLDKSGLKTIVPQAATVMLNGGHDADGMQRQPLDELTARQSILRLKDTVSAFAISSMFATRNNAHELKLRALVEELSGKPVACGHELASSLGAPQRAQTAVLNARMIPYIQQLLHCVQKILSTAQITAPLMIVKGDGSLINTATALQQPVTTVLSGPAASVVGACALSGVKNALVVDMGGTTTDIAIVTNGQPQLCSSGAKVGNWQPMVEAVKVFCSGLGGDSEVRISPGKGLEIGPRRVIPLCLLAQQYPAIISKLEAQLASYPNARNNKFVLRLSTDELLVERLGEEAQYAWKELEKGPLELEWASQQERHLGRGLAKLQRAGLAIYSGFTPTDAAQVLGKSNHLNSEAAILAAKIWSRQMSSLYGLPAFKKDDATEPSQQVYDLVIGKISATLIEASLNQLGVLAQAQASKLTALLTELIINPQQQALFNIAFASDYPIVAVGAPASSYYPTVANRLNQQLLLPRHGEVANAVGAVMGSVVQRAHITISQPSFGLFRLYHQQQPQSFSTFAAALSCAQTLVKEDALRLAKAAGAISVEIVLSRTENQIAHEFDPKLFIDCQVTATATGRADCHSLGFQEKPQPQLTAEVG
ncbi:MAG: hypothetical protein OFPI_22180 [Osedax symbiont Rs2]|nr:MAG: hypothetical protein OFPI_22180 [Osedax symbiont Rs2]